MTKHAGLIIDDDASIHQTYKAILAKLPVQFSSAYDGRMGLEQLKQSRFDIVLLDLNMPEMNGIELLEEAIAGSLSLPPVIVCSSVYDKVFIMGALSLGASSYLVKPIDVQKLRAAVSDYLGIAELKEVDLATFTPAVISSGTTYKTSTPESKKAILAVTEEKEFPSLSRAMGYMVVQKKTATLKVIAQEGVGILTYEKGKLCKVIFNDITGIDALEQMRSAWVKTIKVE
jgi:DNA-binding response OmpR family regulator